MKGAAMLAMIVLVATLTTFWFGPYWFILIVGLGCVLWVVISACVAAGRADDQMTRMVRDHVRDYVVGTDDLGNEFIVPVESSVSRPTGDAHRVGPAPAEKAGPLRLLP